MKKKCEAADFGLLWPHLGGPAASRGTRFGCWRAGSGAVCPSRLCRGQLRHVCEVWPRACWRRGSVFMGAFRLLFGKAQRSLVTARASTSASSLECRCAPPISRASPAMALCGVVATAPPLVMTFACRCAPPSVAGESRCGSARCGGDRHVWGFLLARPSHRRGRVRERLRAVWRRPTPSVQARTL